MSEPQNDNGVLKINGNKFAVGMIWFSGGATDERKLTNHRVKLVKGDYFVNRNSVAKQVGIGWLKKGHRNGMLAAAPILADKLVGEWHGVFKANNGWWYVKVHSDNIAPHGDVFFTDEEEAKEVFREAHKSHTWPRAYAPDSWDIEGDNISEVDLADILDTKNKDMQLVAVGVKAFAGSGVGVAALVLVISIILGGGAAAYLYLPDLLAPPAPPPRKIEPLPPVKKVEEPKEEDIAIERPQLRPTRMIYACGEVFEDLIRPIPGWPISRAECSIDGVMAEWKKSSTGSLQAARQYGSQFPKDVRVTVDQATIKAQQSFPAVSGVPATRWLSKEDAVFLMEKRFKNAGVLKLSFTGLPEEDGNARSRRRDNRNDDEEEYIVHPKVNFSLQTTLSPGYVATLFDIPGTEIKKIEWNFASSIWQYTGYVDLNLTEAN